MGVLGSRLDPGADAHRANRAANLELLAELERPLAQARAGPPPLAVVFAGSAAGGAYVPGLSDHTIMVRERAKVFLGGPPLVRMATGEQANDEERGGAEMHAPVSRLAD